MRSGGNLCGLVGRVPDCRARVLGCDSWRYQMWIWNGVYSALVRINEELHERKVAAPV
jgi:peroxiredoxin